MIIKKTIIHVIRALIFFSIAIVFVTIKLYDVNLNIIHPLTDEPYLIERIDSVMYFWHEVFELQIQNWLLALLFSGLGILEVLEMKK